MAELRPAGSSRGRGAVRGGPGRDLPLGHSPAAAGAGRHRRHPSRSSGPPLVLPAAPGALCRGAASVQPLPRASQHAALLLGDSPHGSLLAQDCSAAIAAAGVILRCADVAHGRLKLRICLPTFKL